MATSPRIPFTNSNASVLLDVVRALAAMLVCLEHWRNMLFVDYHQIQAHRVLFAVPYILMGAGHQAVVIFFVLSGYLISGSVFRLTRRGQFSWKLYLTHRLVRLWIVLIPALALGALLDLSGIHFHLAPDWYSDRPATHTLVAGAAAIGADQGGNHMSGGIAGSLNVHTFFGNLAFLQGILVRPLGSNSPLWSLANEFWYYILFPCAFLLLRRGDSLLSRGIHALVFLACAWFIGRPILELFPIWLLGTLLAAIPPPHSSARLRTFATFLYCPILFYLGKANHLSLLASDYILAAATFLFLWVLLGAGSPAPSTAWVHLSRVAARFSYTLYLVHLPLLILLAALIEGETRWEPDTFHVACALAILLLLIAYAYAIASLTEFRTDGVRTWIEARILGMRLSDSGTSRSKWLPAKRK